MNLPYPSRGKRRLNHPPEAETTAIRRRIELDRLAERDPASNREEIDVSVLQQQEGRATPTLPLISISRGPSGVSLISTCTTASRMPRASIPQWRARGSERVARLDGGGAEVAGLTVRWGQRKPPGDRHVGDAGMADNALNREIAREPGVAAGIVEHVLFEQLIDPLVVELKELIFALDRDDSPAGAGRELASTPRGRWRR